MFESEFFQRSLFGNTYAAYTLFALIFFGSLLILKIFEKVVFGYLKKLAEKKQTSTDDFLLTLVQKNIVPLLYVTAFYFAARQLIFSEFVQKGIWVTVIALFVVQVTRLILAVLIYLLQKTWFKSGGGAGTWMASKSILTILRVIVWGVAVVFFLDNLGVNVSAVVAGLGIGGVALALASQTILGDLFNYFVIFFDRPFEEGDFVIVGDLRGLIEHIGIKTTRIRSLDGEQIVISNSDLTGSRIRNYKRMAERRVLFQVGVTYQTPVEKVKKIPGIIKEIISKVEHTRFDRAHFKEFGDFSLNIEIVYYVLGADYNQYMDIQQKINFAIQEAFAKESIEFAYPTQTLFVTKTS